jgi:uncharacterized repeat protein (TIGR04042 family)
MPEMRFRIRWPDGQRESCYSPSLVVKEHLVVGDCYELADFLQRCRTALTIASARVEARYGRPCLLALGQLAEIERRSLTFPPGDGKVCVEAFED